MGSTSEHGTARGTQRNEPLAGARILLVEDEALVALELNEIFRSTGSNVIGPFASLAQATQAARGQAIDVAILDTNLNGEMVYPFAEELEARAIPFLFLTGYDSSNLPDRFRAVPRVSKPFDRARLLKEVQTMVTGESYFAVKERRPAAK